MRRTRGSVALAVAVGLVVSACSDSSESDEAAAEPATLETVAGPDHLSRVILSERAAQRLDIRTEHVTAHAAGGDARTAIPYAAVIYTPDGAAWTYTSPAARTFIRHRIDVSDVEGDAAVLSAGPPVGTPVVTVGAAELFGTEFDVGH